MGTPITVKTPETEQEFTVPTVPRKGETINFDLGDEVDGRYRIDSVEWKVYDQRGGHGVTSYAELELIPFES